jgi:CBS domain containing-hemolysin-like protein
MVECDNPAVSMALGVLVVLLLTAATGFFVAQEFAYVAVDRGQLRRLAAEGDIRAERAYRVTERLSFMLSGAQLGITVTGLMVGYAAEPLIGRGLTEALGVTGLPPAVRLTLSVVLVMAFSTVVQMVLGELAPKNLAIARSVPLARALARPTLVYLAVAGPVIRLFDSAATRLLRAVGIEPVQELEHAASPEDLEGIIVTSTDAGALPEHLSALLDRSLSFRELTAAAMLTPWVDVVSLGPGDTGGSLLTSAAQHGHARFPVVDAAGQLVGIVSVADLLGVPSNQRSTVPVSTLARPALVLPEVITAPAALESLRKRHTQTAVIVDEHGSLSGLLSFEDIAEELVGEILDEDDAGPPERADLAADGTWTVSARLRVDEVAARTGIGLNPDGGELQTLSRVVLTALGRTARVGDEVSVPLLGAVADLGTPAAGIGAQGTGLAVLHVVGVARQVPDRVSIRVAQRSGSPGEEAARAAGEGRS